MIACTAVDKSKIKIISLGIKGNVERWDVTYPMDKPSKRLVVHLPYPQEDQEAGISTSGVDNGTSGKYKTQRKTIPLFLDKSRSEDMALGALVDEIAEVLASRFGATVKSPLKTYEKDGDTRFSIWCKLIESSGGVMYTRAYDVDNNKIDVHTLTTPMVIRPAISMQVSKTQQSGYSLSCYVTEMCVLRHVQSEGWSILSPKSTVF